MRGDRTINEDEAAIVRRIFRDYAAGARPRASPPHSMPRAFPAPRHGLGRLDHPRQPERGTGILNNELYIGRLVWNRLRYVEDPGDRQARLAVEGFLSI